MLGGQAWLVDCVPVHHRGVGWGWGQSSLQASHNKLQKTFFYGAAFVNIVVLKLKKANLPCQVIVNFYRVAIELCRLWDSSANSLHSTINKLHGTLHWYYTYCTNFLGIYVYKYMYISKCIYCFISIWYICILFNSKFKYLYIDGLPFIGPQPGKKQHSHSTGGHIQMISNLKRVML